MTSTIAMPTVNEVLSREWWRVKSATNSAMAFLRQKGLAGDRDAIESGIGLSLWAAAKQWCQLTTEGNQPPEAARWWKRVSWWARNNIIKQLWREYRAAHTTPLSDVLTDPDCVPDALLTDDYPLCTVTDLLGPDKEALLIDIVNGKIGQADLGRRAWRRIQIKLAEKLEVAL